MTTTEVRCPKCGSNELSANKKGFSGKNEVVGGLLTGVYNFAIGCDF